MQEITKQVKDIIGGLVGILIAFTGLSVITYILFGETLGKTNVISQLTTTLNGMVGSEGTFAGLLTLLIILAVFARK